MATRIYYLTVAATIAGVAGLAGCQQTNELATSIGMKSEGSQGDVAVVDESERAHKQAGPTTADYMAFAEEITNDMLTSRFVQSWGDKKPRLILGHVVNNTDNENIRVRDIYDRIQGTLLNSGLVRVLDSSATNFDYIVKPTLSSMRQYGDDGEELAYFTLTLKMFTLQGELKGQWSDDLALAKTS